MSPRNLYLGKISMEGKGKVVTIEIDDEDEDLEAVIDEIEADEEME